MKTHRFSPFVSLVLACAFIFILPLSSGCAPKQLSRTEYLMDTVVSVKLFDFSDTAVLDEMFSMVRQLERDFSCRADGELSRLNAAGFGSISPELEQLLSTALEVCRLARGAFDITVRPYTELWDFSAGTVPDKAALEAASESVDYRRITLTSGYADLGGTRLDLGGCAKGYICARAADLLRQRGVKSAILDFGGNIYCIGSKGGRPFSVAVADPRGGVLSEYLSLEDACAVTSGIYQRRFEKDGVTYHHILNPATGMPENNLLASATVICDDPCLADCLSTAVMVAGSSDFLSAYNKNIRILAVYRSGEVKWL